MAAGVSKHGVVLGVALCAACGGDGGATNDGDAEVDETSSAASGPVPLERFERELAEAVCAAADVCNLGNFVSLLREDGRCVEAMERYISGSGIGVARLSAAVRSGEATYDADAARACVESFADRCPPTFNLLVNGRAPDTWCPEAFPGSCATDEKLPWEPPLPQGTQCDVIGHGAPCAAGLACAFDSSTCQPCDGTSEQGLRCQEEPVEGLTELLLGDRPEGADCPFEDVKTFCNPGLVCAGEEPTCVVPRPDGMACTFGL